MVHWNVFYFGIVSGAWKSNWYKTDWFKQPYGKLKSKNNVHVYFGSGQIQWNSGGFNGYLFSWWILSRSPTFDSNQVQPEVGFVL